MSSLVWVELDRAAVAHNLSELRRGIEGDALLCAVVKGNAYGHGAREMASLLGAADWLGVNSFEEAVEIEGAAPGRPVMIMGYVPGEQLEHAVRSGYRLTVYNRDTLVRLTRLPAGLPPAHLHVKIETGTARQGVVPEDLEIFLDGMVGHPALDIEGVSTHYANVEDTMNHDYTLQQLERFEDALSRLRVLGVKVRLVHSAATGALMLLPRTHQGLVRAGIGIYGLWPSRETYLSTLLGKRPIQELTPVLSWKTRLVQVKDLPAGSSVSYGCTYKTTRTTRVGVLPVGYADGYDRGFGNVAYVLVRGRRAPVIGRICMNMTMVDVTDIPGAELEDEVVLLGVSGPEVLSADTLAGWIGTINYEVVTRISPLLPRRIVP